MRDIIDLQFSRMARLLVDSQNLEPTVELPNSCSGAEDILLKIGSQHNIFTFTKNNSKTTWSDIKFVYNYIMPLTMQTP